jgi:hypothetical protein
MLEFATVLNHDFDVFCLAEPRPWPQVWYQCGFG